MLDRYICIQMFRIIQCIFFLIIALATYADAYEGEGIVECEYQYEPIFHDFRYVNIISQKNKFRDSSPRAIIDKRDIKYVPVIRAIVPEDKYLMSDTIVIFCVYRE